MSFRVYDLNVDTDVPTLFAPLPESGQAHNFSLKQTNLSCAGEVIHDIADFDGGPRLTVWKNDDSFDLSYRDIRCRLKTGGIDIDIRQTSISELTRTLNRVVFPIHAILKRDLLAMHSCVATFAGATICFVGPSHIGKSTLGWHLHTRGHTLVTDDLAVFDGIEVLPGLPSLRLWEAAGAVEDVRCDEALISETTKRWFLPTEPGVVDRRTVTAIVSLTDGPFGFSELTHAQSLPILLQQNFSLQNAAPSVNHRRLKRCKSVVDNTPVFATGWPRTDDISQLIDTLLKELPKWI